MTFLEKLQLIERVDQLIRMKATGSANDLARKLGVSRRNVFHIINTMKAMDAPIEYCPYKKSFYYKYPCELMIGFVEKEKIKGGMSKNIINFFLSAKNLHSN